MESRDIGIGIVMLIPSFDERISEGERYTPAFKSFFVITETLLPISERGFSLREAVITISLNW